MEKLSLHGAPPLFSYLHTCVWLSVERAAVRDIRALSLCCQTDVLSCTLTSWAGPGRFCRWRLAPPKGAVFSLFPNEQVPAEQKMRQCLFYRKFEMLYLHCLGTCYQKYMHIQQLSYLNTELCSYEMDCFVLWILRSLQVKFQYRRNFLCGVQFD